MRKCDIRLWIARKFIADTAFRCKTCGDIGVVPVALEDISGMVLLACSAGCVDRQLRDLGPTNRDTAARIGEELSMGTADEYSLRALVPEGRDIHPRQIERLVRRHLGEPIAIVDFDALVIYSEFETDLELHRYLQDFLDEPENLIFAWISDRRTDTDIVFREGWERIRGSNPNHD